MCQAFVWSFDAITSINWLEIIKATAPAATAFIAFKALRNWQRQDKAKREAEFLDQLIEAVHAYIAEIIKPITIMRMVKIGMESHVQTWESGDQASKVIDGAIAYIKKNGDQDAKRLLDVLELVQPSAIKLKSLVAKGQVFKFDDYVKCQKAVVTLAGHFERLEAFAAIIGSSTWNWEHPEVQKSLKSIIAIDEDGMRESIQEANVSLIEFARDTYKRIYG